MYCPRCRTRYKDPADVCRYCEIPLVEQLPSRTLTDYTEGASWRDDDEYAFAFADEADNDDELDSSADDIEEIDQLTRVKLLNRHFVLHVFWFAAWLAAGFLAAYLNIPDDWGEGPRIIACAAAIFSALLIASLILRIRIRRPPDGIDNTGT